jgi:hypothetical protein
MVNILKGWLGEKVTTLGLWMNLDSGIYQRVHDVIIPAKIGTTQIDHIILSIYGIFVIETKNYSGWIFGSPTDSTWCQSAFGKKSRFQNPLHQNFRHIKSLSKYLNLQERLFKSVVFFIGDCEIKTGMPPNVMTKGLASYIQSHTEVLLSQDQVNTYKKTLDVAKSTPWYSKKRHVQILRARLSSTTECPKCGSPLVERTVRSGYHIGETFLGCSGYPECKFTRSTPAN